MAELRTLLEREMNRAGTPSYSFADLAQRRERKQRDRRIAAGVVALALIALVIGGWLGALTLDRSTPAIRPERSPTWCRPGRTACHGPGTFSFNFWPRLDVTLPFEGWRMTTFDQTHVHLEMPLGSEGGVLLISREPRIVQAPCNGIETRVDPPRDPSELVEELAQMPRLLTTEPVMVMVGGLPGIAIDAELSAGAAPCAGQDFTPVAGAYDGYGEYEAATIAPGERSRIIILAIPPACPCVEPGYAGLIAIEFSGPADEFDEIVADVQSVLDSMVFDLDAERHGPRADEDVA